MSGVRQTRGCVGDRLPAEVAATRFSRRMAMRPGSSARSCSSSPSPALSACERRRRFRKSAENRPDFLSVSIRLSRRLWPIDSPVPPRLFPGPVIHLTGLSAFYCAFQQIAAAWSFAHHHKGHGAARPGRSFGDAQAQPDLLQIVNALDAARRLEGGLDRRQKQCDQNGDDGDDNEQFDRCETPATSLWLDHGYLT